MPDFSVDLEALATAANGIKDVLDELGTHQVADIDCNPDSFGHDRLAATVRDFCGRWQNGVTALTQDGAEIADRLTQTVSPTSAPTRWRWMRSPRLPPGSTRPGVWRRCE